MSVTANTRRAGYRMSTGIPRTLPVCGLSSVPVADRASAAEVGIDDLQQLAVRDRAGGVVAGRLAVLGDVDLAVAVGVVASHDVRSLGLGRRCGRGFRGGAAATETVKSSFTLLPSGRGRSR